MDQKETITVEIDRVYVDDEHFLITYIIFDSDGNVSRMTNINEKHHWGENHSHLMDLLSNQGYAIKLALEDYGKENKESTHSYQGQSYTLLGKLKK